MCTPANWLVSLSARVHERLVGDHEATTARLISVKNTCLVSHNSTQGTSAEHQRRTWMPEAFDSTRRCPGGMPACCARFAQAGSKNSTHPCLVFQDVFKWVFRELALENAVFVSSRGCCKRRPGLLKVRCTILGGCERVTALSAVPSRTAPAGASSCDALPAVVRFCQPHAPSSNTLLHFHEVESFPGHWDKYQAAPPAVSSAQAHAPHGMSSPRSFPIRGPHAWHRWRPSAATPFLDDSTQPGACRGLPGASGAAAQHPRGAAPACPKPGGAVAACDGPLSQDG